MGSWLEKDLVLAVGLHLTQLLRQAGARVGITRNQDMELGHLLPIPGRSRYHRDLAARVQAARRLGPDLAVSLHANASRNPEMSGAMVFYGLSRAASRRAAQRILQELVEVMPGNQNAALPGDLYVLRESPYVAVLVELGFLTHPKDRQVLINESGQQTLARALYTGIVRFFQEEGAGANGQGPGDPAEPPPLPTTLSALAMARQAAALLESDLCPNHADP